MKRDDMIGQLGSIPEWDICVIGGGATGLGIAVDAASRGYKTVLFEKYDFAKGTSSRSTKLVHGGVRYLQQLNIKLVLEGLNERGLMLKNAPHLVKNQSFIIPNYEWWEYPYYGLGLKAYDWMAGSLGLGPSEFLSLEETLLAAPTLNPEGLRGGIRYHDGQFDDTRMAMHLAMTAADHGAVVLNYFPVEGFIKSDEIICGVKVRDVNSNVNYDIMAKAVINATGVFSDEIKKMDLPGAEDEVSPSQGIHLVLDQAFLPTDTAILIPRTDDGRVLFAVPWHHKIIVGTTDTPMDHVDIEPRALPEEIEFVLQHIRHYLHEDPSPEDIRSVYCGLRPLVKGASKVTATLNRDHHISISDSELISIIGGKWTTYRRMAEDTVDVAIQKEQLPFVKCLTASLPIHGYREQTDFNEPLAYYGSDRVEIEKLINQNPDLKERIHPDLAYIKAEVVWAVREEMSLTIEDVLARRTRMLFLDARAAIASAPIVADLMAIEMGKDEQWKREQIDTFSSIAKNYLPG
ncbi:MAG TPA: glycerol-3-phosphate dehydrogenase/oxidase [Saprospiraceae bacterium]|nr:glycerol-3-phosphate dehydrogenase/oxidase [Saprospiraceae bacterium]